MDPPNQNWLNRLEDAVSKNDPNVYTEGCGVVPGQCKPNSQCTQLVNDNFPYVYWIGKGVTGMHVKFADMHAQLLTSVWSDSQKIPQIAEDFSISPDDMPGLTDAPSFMRAALVRLRPP